MAEFLEVVSATIEQRGQNYGDPKQLFDQIARRWSLVLKQQITPQQVVMCLIDLKLARLNANPAHADSIIDIAGYAAVMAKLQPFGHWE